MEQKHVCQSVCDGLPTLSANHPWLVDQYLQDHSRDHIVYTIHNHPPSQFRYRIPSFIPGRHIRGCFYGWVILSNHPHNDMWSLWNPVTSNIIRLPRLISKNGDLGSDIIQQCCLSSPPDDQGSIFMITAQKYAIVFCRLDGKRKRLKWVEMSYAKQMRSIVGHDSFLCGLTCCNGKVYALHSGRGSIWVIHIDIVVKGKEIMISLLPYSKFVWSYMNCCLTTTLLLKGCCTELFCIELGFNEATKETLGGVRVFKLNITNLRWEEMKDLEDTAFFVDLAHDYSVFYSPSELGGYVHLLDKPGKVIHSFNLKNKTIALSFMSERRLHEEIKSQQENEMAVRDEEENMELRWLLNMPFDVLKTIMEFCVGIEYLNFRATCKLCHLAAPMIRWSKGGRLQTYSLVSPWLMVVHKHQGVISFTDPMSGDKYFIKTPQQLIGDLQIHCFMGGWLLIRRYPGPVMLFNPFTCDIRELPFVPYLDSYFFLAPPTSKECMIIGFTTIGQWQVYVHLVGQHSTWFRFHINFSGALGSHSFHFATYCRENLYALCYNGRLALIDGVKADCTWLNSPTNSCMSPKQNFLMKCDQHLVLVVVGMFGESVEVFKMNDSRQWEKTESLGKHVIFIGGKTSLCIEAKTPVMANKIYFPRLHSEKRRIVFYSLETRRYHSSNIEGGFSNFIGTEHCFDPHVWIEPSWS